MEQFFVNIHGAILCLYPWSNLDDTTLNSYLDILDHWPHFCYHGNFHTRRGIVPRSLWGGGGGLAPRGSLRHAVKKACVMDKKQNIWIKSWSFAQKPTRK